jgi:hypothetical protein
LYLIFCPEVSDWYVPSAIGGCGPFCGQRYCAHVVLVNRCRWWCFSGLNVYMDLNFYVFITKNSLNEVNIKCLINWTIFNDYTRTWQCRVIRGKRVFSNFPSQLLAVRAPMLASSIPTFYMM